MYLVDEDDNVGVVFNLFEQSANTLFELSAILRSGHHTCHVEAYDSLIEQHGRCFALGDKLCQSLDNGAFAYARFANDDGVVLFSTTKNFGNAQDFPFSAHHGVKLIFHCGLCKVGRKTVENGRFTIALSRLSGLCALVTLCTVAARHGFVFLVVRKSEAILRWHSPLLQVSQCIFVVQVVAFKHLLGSIVHTVV